LSAAPLDFVDLFFNFERFEVVKLGFVGLELGMELILARLFLQVYLSELADQDNGSLELKKSCVEMMTYRLIPLEKNDATSFVASG
jgi:hypothetical protein